MNESTEELQGPKPGAGFPLTENMIQTGADARLSPEATGGRWQFPGLRGQGLATKSSRHLAAYFNKTLTGGLAQRPTLKNALEIRSPRPRTVLRPRAWVVPFLGWRDYENLD